MKKTVVCMLLLAFTALSSFAQIRMKLKYPKCEVVSQDVFAGIKKYKTMKIETAEDFAKYFKLAEGESINFEKNLVLAGFVGEGNEEKFIEINAATYDPKAKYLNVRFDIKDEKLEDNGKFCVAVVPKSYSYKKVAFLKGKLYNMSQSGE
ncbi:MAG TPA: hypothetical protein PLA16_05195 [Chitinophagales bacterium]|jgi:hypothetical protein|nr:hypothetical protein [Chitinophagales bacterium]HPA35738.1 hypothetical protein [Chitinophagales bacterium]HQD12515.1 hypothetical protein [Chitinophagales bacterium]HQO32460.1 hypothetical protein [Chitinophagales bacterium]HQO90553.1 hypothetical protein [Chitinophagales bacterium]